MKIVLLSAHKARRATKEATSINRVFDALRAAINDRKLNRNEVAELVNICDGIVKKKSPYYWYLPDMKPRRTHIKLMELGYLEMADPVELFVDENETISAAGESLGWFVRLNIKELEK